VKKAAAYQHRGSCRAGGSLALLAAALFIAGISIARWHAGVMAINSAEGNNIILSNVNEMLISQCGGNNEASM